MDLSFPGPVLEEQPVCFTEVQAVSRLQDSLNFLQNVNALYTQIVCLINN